MKNRKFNNPFAILQIPHTTLFTLNDQKKNLISNTLITIFRSIDLSNNDIDYNSRSRLYIDEYMRENEMSNNKKEVKDRLTDTLSILITNPILWEEEIEENDKIIKVGHLTPFLTDICFNSEAEDDNDVLFDFSGREYYEFTINEKIDKYIDYTAIKHK